MKSKNITNGLLIATITSIMTACGGGGTSNNITDNSTNQESNNTLVDTQAPTILSVSPSDLETEVDLDVNVSILFDENMLASSLNNNSITLKKTNNTTVEGNISFNATNTATFSPKKKLALLSEYVLTVNSTVSDLVGNTLENEEKYNFTTRDGKWQEAKLLEINNAGDAYSPQVSIDSEGNAIAVWYQYDGMRGNIWANRFTPTSGWSSAEKIENDDSGNADSPQVSMDSEGNAIAVWYQYDGTRNNIWANRFTPTSGWSSAEKIENDDNGDAYSPQVSIDSEGNAIAVWSQYDGTRYNIWANRFTPTSGWSSAEKIEDDSGNADSPQVSIDSEGNAIAVWYQYDGTRYNIWANRFTPTSGWSSAEKIKNDDSGDAYSPQVSIDSENNAIAVWYQDDGTRYNIWANRFSPTSGWSSAEKIEDDDSEDAESPQVSIDSEGNAIAVWSQYDGTRYNIWANKFSPTSGWSSAEKIENDDNGDAYSPQVSIDSEGNAIAVWYQYDGTRYNIWTNRFTHINGWSSAEKIENHDSEDAESPQVSIDSEGNAIAVWYQFDGTRYNILVNHFK